MSDTPSITVFVPALNEQWNLESAVASIWGEICSVFDDWEIIICNDGSTDRTGEIAEKIRSYDPRIRVIHHSTSQNVGASYLEAVRRAEKEFFVMFPGDNENDAEDMHKLFSMAGSADMIVPYTVNTEVRPLWRQFTSRLFVMLLNAISGCRIRYYNGTVLHRTELLRQCQIQSKGFGYQAEIILDLICRGFSFKEVGVRIRGRSARRSRAFGLDNLWDVSRFLWRIFLRYRVAPIARVFISQRASSRAN